ncbi:hypothetical protein [Nocardioides sp. URHA0020]|uniref:hypothetical protein n=1 Tax=Nocardioides sp. URHA0020 TaxID=1380392 RepID=UPI0006855CF3|nr:hypothetical protein [Nocardioides sp. URHA0020]
MEIRRLIGYWRNERNPEFPDPHSLIDATWDDDERQTVWAYLTSGTMAVSYMGLSPCRFCGEDNGALEYTDGVYQWPEGLAHYVSEHNVRLPSEVVAHAVERLDALEATTTSLDWWLTQTT